MLHGAFSECLMLRRALVVWLAFLLLAHGIAHVAGFLVNWQIASFPDLTYRTTIFGTSVDVGPDGIRLLGLCFIALSLNGRPPAPGIRRVDNLITVEPPIEKEED